METWYELKKKSGKIVLAYITDGREDVYAEVPEEYEEYLRLVARTTKIYDILAVMRVYILMKLLDHVIDKAKATDVVRMIRDFEVMFWFSKFHIASTAVEAFKVLHEIH